MPQIEEVVAFAKRNQTRYLSELKEWLAIPSISTLPEHKPDMQRAAEWAARQMAQMGLEDVGILPTGGHPVVYGEWLKAAGRPTVLLYGHYDVQPADPLDEWTSPPFEPTIRDDNIYARGASDMKGDGHGFLKALEAWLQSGGLPVNVRVMIEGEEEVGSPNLGPFIDAHREQLKSDVVLNADGGIIGPDQPSICIGLRGLAYFELWVYGPEHDLHSGEFGGSIQNPAQALCELIAGMHDADGHITLPGFYDKVRVLSKEERDQLARTPHSDEEWLKTTGAPALYGEKSYTTLERLGVRPTLEVNGLLSGFTGQGAKTVLPAKAMAKISMRLVPYQDDQEAGRQLVAYVEKNAPPTVRWEVKPMIGGPAVLVRNDTAGVRAAEQALEATFGVRPVFKYEGGSIPVVSMLQSKLGVDSVILGFGLPGDNFHAPNEKMYLPNYFRGIETYIRFFDAVAKG